MLSPALRKPLYITAFVYSKRIRLKQNIEKKTQIAVGKSKPVQMYFSFALNFSIAEIKYVLVGVLTVRLQTRILQS